jgi:hypothetical protein
VLFAMQRGVAFILRGIPNNSGRGAMSGDGALRTHVEGGLEAYTSPWCRRKEPQRTELGEVMCVCECVGVLRCVFCECSRTLTFAHAHHTALAQPLSHSLTHSTDSLTCWASHDDGCDDEEGRPSETRCVKHLGVGLRSATRVGGGKTRLKGKQIVEEQQQLQICPD